jgi:ABC-type transporter MlaC component
VHRATVSLCLIFSLFTFSVYSSPQDATMPQPGIQREQDEAADRLQKEQEKKANQKRQADLKRDAEKLLKLSTELKEYVDKTNENVMSVEVINKAEEIEKLAHSVKTKMRGDL